MQQHSLAESGRAGADKPAPPRGRLAVWERQLRRKWSLAEATGKQKDARCVALQLVATVLDQFFLWDKVERLVTPKVTDVGYDNGITAGEGYWIVPTLSSVIDADLSLYLPIVYLFLSVHLPIYFSYLSQPFPFELGSA